MLALSYHARQRSYDVLVKGLTLVLAMCVGQATCAKMKWSR